MPRHGIRELKLRYSTGQDQKHLHVKMQETKQTACLYCSSDICCPTLLPSRVLQRPGAILIMSMPAKAASPRTQGMVPGSRCLCYTRSHNSFSTLGGFPNHLSNKTWPTPKITFMRLLKTTAVRDTAAELNYKLLNQEHLLRSGGISPGFWQSTSVRADPHPPPSQTPTWDSWH